MGNTRNTGYLQNIVLYDENDNITLPARLAVTGTVAINNTTPYDTTQFSLDVNGGLIVKNINKTAQFVLINANPATGGNNAFVVHTVGGTSASSYADIQGYYGTSIAGSTVLRLNPQGGNVLVGSLAGTGSRMVVASATGVLSTQAIVTLGDLSGVSTARTITINGTTQDLSADRTFTLYTDNISEDGSPVNLWFTNARARAAISVTGSGSYDSATGVITVTGGVTAVNTKTGDVTLTTSDITEGTRLYYTDTRVGTYLTSNNYATQTYVGTAIANLVDAAPGTLDTLNELAAALGDDPNFATSVATSIGTKEPVITAGTTTQYWRGDKTWQTLPTYTLSGLGGVPTTRTITINGTALDLSADRSFTINSMVYPGAGIAVSTGSAWGTSITDNSSNWNTAYGWGNHASAGYLTTSSAASTYVSLTGSYANPSWITSLAYSKITGVPAFLTSYTETDTLASVTGRGNTTSSAISAANFQVAAQVLNLDTVKTPGLYHYDGAYTGTQPVQNWYNVRTIEVGNSTRASQFVMPYSADRIFYRRNTDSGWQPYVELYHTGNIPTWNQNTTGTAANSTLWNGAGYSYTATSTVNSYILGLSANGDWRPMTTAAIQSWLGLGSLAYSSATIPTNNNQLTNGAGYITGVTNISGTAGSAPILTASGGLTTQYGNGTIGYSYAITTGTAGLFSTSDNSNAIITINRHPDNYYSQLGFNSSGSLFYRSFSATAINTSQGWQTIWTSSSLTNLNQLTNGPGYITSYTETDTLSSVTGRGASTTSTITINKNTAGLILNRDGVTNYNGIYYSTATTNKWFIGMRENLSSNNHIHYSEQISVDVLTLNVANGNATIYGNLTIGNGTEVLGLIQMGANGRYGMGISGAYTNVYSHDSGLGVRLGSYNGTTFTPVLTVNNTGTVIATGNITGANLSGTNTGDQTSVSGNAGTVTNGVYTTGDQTIGGIKTFGKRTYFGSSSGWDDGSLNGENGNITNVHFQGHADFWIGAGNGKWYTTAAAGEHDLIINTMQAQTSYDRGISFTSSFSGTSGYRLGKWYSKTSAATSYLSISGGLTVGGTTTLASISGTDQTVENTYGAYLHLGDWAVGRTATGAVLVNTAYRADYATDLFDMNISRFTNNSGYITSSGILITIQDTAPAGVAGKLWWESDTGKLKVYYGSAWVDASPIPDSSLFFAKAGGSITGDVSIGQTLNVVGNTLVQGTISAFGDVIAYSSSDARLKDNITVIESPLEKVSKINGVSFNWNDKQTAYEVGKKDIGVIAQEIEEVLPELVTTRDNGYKAVRYEKIVALLIEAVKEQQTQINNLTDKLNNL